MQGEPVQVYSRSKYKTCLFDTIYDIASILGDLQQGKESLACTADRLCCLSDNNNDTGHRRDS